MAFQFADHVLEFFNKVDLHNNPEIENADEVIESMAQIVQRFKSELTIENSDEENDEEIDDAEVDDDTENETIDFVETDEVIDMEIVDSDQAPDGKTEFELTDSEEETDDKTDIEPADSGEESDENIDKEIVDSDEESDKKTEFELMDSDEESDSETYIIGGVEAMRKQVETLKTFQNAIRRAIRVGITLQEVRDIIRSSKLRIYSEPSSLNLTSISKQSMTAVPRHQPTLMSRSIPARMPPLASRPWDVRKDPVCVLFQQSILRCG